MSDRLGENVDGGADAEYGPGWGHQIHIRTIHSMFGVTFAGFIAGSVSTASAWMLLIGVSAAIAIGIASFWWLPGAREITHDWIASGGELDGE